MSQIRDALATQVKIGSVSFYATSVSGPGGERRIARYTGVGVDGAVTEDLGAQARESTISATIDESTYIKLRDVRDAGKVVDITHPLFGTFSGRITKLEYTANPSDMVEVSVGVVEHGDPAALLAPVVIPLNSAAQNAKAAFDDLGLDDLDGLSTPDLSTAIGNMESSWDSFDSVLDSALSGDVLFDEMAAAFDDIATTGQQLIDAVDSAYSDIESTLTEYPIQDGIYELISAGRDVVNSLERQANDNRICFHRRNCP
jgi:prophage DNA circulation protein